MYINPYTQFYLKRNYVVNFLGFNNNCKRYKFSLEEIIIIRHHSQDKLTSNDFLLFCERTFKHHIPVTLLIVSCVHPHLLLIAIAIRPLDNVCLG